MPMSGRGRSMPGHSPVALAGTASSVRLRDVECQPSRPIEPQRSAALKFFPAVCDFIHATDSPSQGIYIDVDRIRTSLVFDPLDALLPCADGDHDELLGACHVVLPHRADPLTCAL